MYKRNFVWLVQTLKMTISGLSGSTINHFQHLSISNMNGVQHDRQPKVLHNCTVCADVIFYCPSVGSSKKWPSAQSLD